MQKNKSRLYNLIACALLIAISIVLTRFLSVPPIFGVRIGFGLMPVMLAGLMFGPGYGFLVGLVADFVGLMLFPSGAWLPGVTLANALTGLFPPLFMHLFRFKKQTLNTLFSIMFTTYLCQTLLSTYFLLSFFAGKSFWALLPTRFLAHTVLAPVNTFIITVLLRALPETNYQLSLRNRSRA